MNKELTTSSSLTIHRRDSPKTFYSSYFNIMELDRFKMKVFGEENLQVGSLSGSHKQMGHQHSGFEADSCLRTNNRQVVQGYLSVSPESLA
jgi:hypothetical protein